MIDFNALEQIATNLVKRAKHSEALRVYLFMSEGDPSLDAGYLAERIAQCYEALGEVPAARYWYGRAVEEGPDVHIESAAARERLGAERYEDLLGLGEA